MIFLPLMMGQAFAFNVYSQFSLTYFFYTVLFGVIYQVYLLYLNDCADETVDRTNARYFLSGGSRVLPEGKLHRKDLLFGATVALVALAGLTLWLAVFLGRPWFCVFAAVAVTLCWAYNLEPLQLSHRGYGEFLQGLGCGVLLPLIGFYLQQGSLREFPWITLLPLYLIFHAGNIVTALPDYPSDKAGNKRSYPVRNGELRARKTVVGILALAYSCVAIASSQLAWSALAIIVIPPALILAGIIQTGTLKVANTTSFATCKQFVIWISASQAWVLCAWIATALKGGVH